ncbi:MAG TPA: carotenoid oxygenase family protein [Acidimicrobiales bacterium]|nr:carotenoid oxygenase family protein [Acidimicrobiales bacterium]
MANPYLTGNFAPVAEELTVDRPLPVDGAVPPVLEGLLVRNGPNPVAVDDPDGYHWFSGDGMVHGVELRDGQAVSYRNRWVRTRKLAAEIGSRPPRGPQEPIDGPANTHVVWHGGKLLALVESGFPHRLTTGLETVCVEDFDGSLTSAMTAHPHVDPDTGAMAFFGYDVFGPPFLRYHELDAAGSLVHSTDVDLPRATMQHDFAVTGTRVAFLDLPVVFDIDLAAAGQSLPFRWDPDAGARVGVLDRGADGTGTRWIGTDPCYVFHVVNAFDDGATVVLDVCRYDRVFDVPPPGLIAPAPPTLERWRVDPVLGRLSATPLDDRGVEFPRIDDTLAGRPYRYAYCVEMSQTADAASFDALVRYDLTRDLASRWDPGPGRYPGEPVFVRDPDGRADDEGWVLSVVYDAGTGSSDLVILDASSFGADPDAVVHLPARVPFGFHGSWVPAARYR